MNGADVYVGGGNLNRAVYWKNGTMVSLPSNVYSFVNAIEIKGNNIYVAGQNGLKPGYWKNGEATQISANSRDAGIVEDMAINGNDVYLAGHEYKFTSFQVATLWKNGIPVYLTGTGHYSDASGVYVYGNDVYVCGYEVDTTGNHFIAEYWKMERAFYLLMALPPFSAETSL